MRSGFEKLQKEEVSVPELIQKVSMRRVSMWFTYGIYVGVLACTFTLYFFQGFRWRGFYLDYSLLHWLGAATVGQMGGLLMMLYKFVFKNG